MQRDKALMGGPMRGDINLMGDLDISLTKSTVIVKLQLHDAIYRLRFY